MIVRGVLLSFSGDQTAAQGSRVRVKGQGAGAAGGERETGAMFPRPMPVKEKATMTTTVEASGGLYRYIPGVFQYSAGVAAAAGYAIERVRFYTPMPLAAGFAWIERYLVDQGLSPLSFCACELRSPAPFTEAGFIAFNRQYCGTLERWGLMRDDKNQIGRASCRERVCCKV